MPYFSRILNPSSSQEPGNPEDGDHVSGFDPRFDTSLDDAPGHDVDAGVGDDVHHDGDLVDARLAEDQLREFAGLLDARVAADLAVVRGLAPVLADRVEKSERTAAGADDETRDCRRTRPHSPPRPGGPNRRLRLPGSRNPSGGRACRVSSGRIPSSSRSFLWVVPRFGLHVDVAVEHHEAAVFEADQRD